MVFEATCLVSRADDIGASLLLRCDNQRGQSTYAFNLPESLQRLAHTHDLTLRHVKAVFIPNCTFECLGGFPSFYLANRSAQIIGPLGFDSVIGGFGYLSAALRKPRLIRLRPCGNPVVYDDDTICVCGLHADAAFAELPNWLTTDSNEIDFVSEDEADPSKAKKLVLAKSKGQMDTSMPIRLCKCEGAGNRVLECVVEDGIIDLTSDLDEDGDDKIENKTEDVTVLRSAASRVQTFKRKRKEKEVASNLKYARTKSGTTKRILVFVVQLKSTKELLIVIMLHDINGLHQLHSQPTWKFVLEQKTIKAVFHLSSLELMRTEEYKTLLTSLPGEQIVFDGSIGEGTGMDVGLSKVFDRGIRLRAAARQNFPLPYAFSQHAKTSGTVFSDGDRPLHTRAVSFLSKIQYKAPSLPLEFTESTLQPSCPGAAISGTLYIEFADTIISQAIESNSRLRTLTAESEMRGLQDSNPWKHYSPFYASTGQSTSPPGLPHRHLQSVLLLNQEIKAQGGPPDYLLQMALKEDPSYLMFLGTGCAEPSAWRGGSAILLCVNQGKKCILLDCGEGTIGQLIRYFGETEAQRLVDNLLLIWISHRHVDHSAGIGALLSRRNQYLPPVTICSPFPIRRMLEEMEIKARMILNASLTEESKLAARLGVSAFMVFPVQHSTRAFGIRINLKTGFSIVYSGDTEPCEALVDAAKACTLLIHESTHAPCHQQHAKETKHSTWEQALDVGTQVSAFRTVLTHFSRRYPGLPDGLTSGKLGPRSAIAFDGLRVRLSDIVFLPFLNPAIEEALMEIQFGADLVDSDEDTIDLVSDASDAE